MLLLAGALFAFGPSPFYEWGGVVLPYAIYGALTSIRQNMSHFVTAFGSFLKPRSFGGKKDKIFVLAFFMRACVQRDPLLGFASIRPQMVPVKPKGRLEVPVLHLIGPKRLHNAGPWRKSN